MRWTNPRFAGEPCVFGEVACGARGHRQGRHDDGRSVLAVILHRLRLTKGKRRERGSEVWRNDRKRLMIGIQRGHENEQLSMV